MSSSVVVDWDARGSPASKECGQNVGCYAKFVLGGAQHVSHLRRSEFFLRAFPAFPRWANLCRAYGAGAVVCDRKRAGETPALPFDAVTSHIRVNCPVGQFTKTRLPRRMLTEPNRS